MSNEWPFNSNGPLGLSGGFLAAVRGICPNLPVAVASGFVDNDLRAGAVRAGVSELILKPFTFAELSEKIERLFE